MVHTFHLHIVTPTKELDLGDVSYLRAPGLDGLFGVMAGHTNALFAIDVGEVKVTIDGEETYFATGGGYAEVTGQEAQLLVETVERSEEIDLSRAETAMRRAKERLSAQDETTDRARAQAALSRAVNRLHIATRAKR
ncbi:MAG: ATP synthase F1 subunit epsilon [Fidelibacterota bacterium]